MKLEINEKVYPINFGMRFLRDINKKIETPIEVGSSIKQQIGLKYYISLLFDNDIEALSAVLIAGNAGLTPNLTQSILDSYFEAESTDIDSVFEAVLGGLEKANVTKKATLQLKKALEANKTKKM